MDELIDAARVLALMIDDIYRCLWLGVLVGPPFGTLMLMLAVVDERERRR